MRFKIRYITIGELEAYVNSDEYQQQTFYPISISRAVSHANNPRARREDVGLILAYDQEKLVGYLGAIPENIYIGKEICRVCWYSCMWVLPDYRRSGIAKLLLEDAGKLYNNRVLITNYIPSSKAAFLKNDQFSEVEVLKGVRAYFKLDLEQIVIRKRPGFRRMKWILVLLDLLFNLLAGSFFRFYRRKAKNYKIDIQDSIDQLSADFIEISMQDSLFKRSTAEINWLMKYPWVKAEQTQNADPDKYYFSQVSPDFRQWILRITDTKDRIKGIALLTRHKRELKIPYLLGGKDIMEDLFNHVYRLMHEQNIRTLITHHPVFTDEVKRRRKYFLLQRSSEYGFMATPEVEKLVQGNFGQFFEGDGDGMFT